MNDLLVNAPAILTAILAIMVAASGITALTPTKLDDKYLGRATGVVNVLLKIANSLALNVAKNKNADDDK